MSDTDFDPDYPARPWSYATFLQMLADQAMLSLVPKREWTGFVWPSAEVRGETYVREAWYLVQLLQPFLEVLAVEVDADKQRNSVALTEYSFNGIEAFDWLAKLEPAAPWLNDYLRRRASCAVAWALTRSPLFAEPVHFVLRGRSYTLARNLDRSVCTRNY